MRLAAAMLIPLLFVVAGRPASAGDWSEEWGGGRMFIQGMEIQPPLEFSGFGGPTLFLNGVAIDPLPCDSRLEPTPERRWCGTKAWPDDDPWRRRLAQQDYAVEQFLALSSLPLVMIGCDYFYRPTGEESVRVLSGLDSGDLEAAALAGAPGGFLRDLRRVASN